MQGEVFSLELNDGGVVYALLDPDTGEKRYVGATAQHPLARLDQHLKKAVNPLVGAWITTLSRPPQIAVLEGPIPKDTLREAEGRWIQRLGAEGCRLLNVHGRKKPKTTEVPEGFQRCSACGRDKPLDDFHLHTGGRRNPSCKVCRKIRRTKNPLRAAELYAADGRIHAAALIRSIHAA